MPLDSHHELPTQDRSWAELQENDLAPFVAAIEESLPAVMVGHLAVSALGSRTAATLEPLVMDDLLRTDLGFTGLVITDAMNMGAVVGSMSSGQAAVQAVRAGADVVLMPNDPVGARDAIVAAVAAGDLHRVAARPRRRTGYR